MAIYFQGVVRMWPGCGQDVARVCLECGQGVASILPGCGQDVARI